MAGIKTDIVEIVAPGSAAAGQTVGITIKVKNISGELLCVLVAGALEYGVLPWPTITVPINQIIFGPGVIQPYSAYFTMPNASVKIHAYSYYYVPEYGYFVFDDEEVRNVSLGVLVSEFNELKITNYVKT